MLTDNFASIQVCEELTRCGIVPRNDFYWIDNCNGSQTLVDVCSPGAIPAYSIADIMKWLPGKVSVPKLKLYNTPLVLTIDKIGFYVAEYPELIKIKNHDFADLLADLLYYLIVRDIIPVPRFVYDPGTTSHI